MLIIILLLIIEEWAFLVELKSVRRTCAYLKSRSYLDSNYMQDSVVAGINADLQNNRYAH